MYAVECWHFFSFVMFLVVKYEIDTEKYIKQLHRLNNRAFILQLNFIE